jgi:hypothetical protein
MRCRLTLPGAMLASADEDQQELSENAMRPQARPEATDHGELLVHNWRAAQLKRLGIPGPMAEAYADRLDWHQVARLVQHGCPPLLALRIVD